MTLCLQNIASSDYSSHAPLSGQSIAETHTIKSDCCSSLQLLYCVPLLSKNAYNAYETKLHDSVINVLGLIEYSYAGEIHFKLLLIRSQRLPKILSLGTPEW